MNPFLSYGSHLKKRFGEKVFKVTIDAGFTCPNRDGTLGKSGCTYCSNAAFNPNQREIKKSVSEQVREGMQKVGKRYGAKKFIAYFQAFTNTYGPPEILRQKYQQALVNDAIVGLAIGTRPDCLPDDVLDVLEEFSLHRYVSLEIGLQSTNNETLQKIHRGHDFAAFAQAVKQARKRNLELCAHVILGLPGETRADMLATAKTLSTMEIQGVKIHPLHICRDTPMEKEYQEGKIQLLSMEEFVATACDFIEILRPDICIHRLTADAPSEILIAPLWIQEKALVIRTIENEFKKRNSRQGRNA